MPSGRSTKGIEEGVFYESMMSPANQSYCLLKVKEGADVAALQQKVFDNANPRKWICVEASNVVVKSKGDLVILIMADTEMTSAEEAIAPKLEANFDNL